ncbi:hypothetical protein Q1695_007799 [Nippostrongylus brasiliensis]|nr:hypothetical protein Q1695_007799 [Nippostrongylus brasiliensis]
MNVVTQLLLLTGQSRLRGRTALTVISGISYEEMMMFNAFLIYLLVATVAADNVLECLRKYHLAKVPELQFKKIIKCINLKATGKMQLLHCLKGIGMGIGVIISTKISNFIDASKCILESESLLRSRNLV